MKKKLTKLQNNWLKTVKKCSGWADLQINQKQYKIIQKLFNLWLQPILVHPKQDGASEIEVASIDDRIAWKTWLNLILSHFYSIRLNL